MTKPKTKPDKKNFCVYIGPTVRGYCEHCMIFMGGRAEAEAALSRFIEKYPAAHDLIVDHKDLAEARLQIKQNGNAMNESYKRLLRQLSAK